MLRVLSKEVLKRTVPSIFTADSASNTSGKYHHISTIEVVEKSANAGFLPV